MTELIDDIFCRLHSHGAGANRHNEEGAGINRPCRSLFESCAKGTNRGERHLSCVKQVHHRWSEAILGAILLGTGNRVVSLEDTKNSSRRPHGRRRVGGDHKSCSLVSSQVAATNAILCRGNTASDRVHDGVDADAGGVVLTLEGLLHPRTLPW